MFVGRENELKELINCFYKNDLQAILIYGKRRIGKTELIEQALKRVNDVISINYQCQRTTYLDNIDKLNSLIADKMSIAKPSFSSIEEILEFLSKEFESKKIILSLDEYPYLRELKDGIDDIFQYFIDHHKNNDLKIIFCGSYANVMEKMISKDAALYQRFRSIILLKELPYYEIMKLYPDSYSDEDKVKLYSVFGGVPYYYNFIDWNCTADENIINSVLKLESPLVNEAESCLNNQLMKINSANLIFQTISNGIINFNDIKNSLRIDNPNNLDAPIKKLIEMELIEKRICINAEKNKRNRIYYSICDNFFGFYFRYVFKYFYRLQLLGGKKFYELIKKDFEEQYIPFIFEKISLQYISYCTRELDTFSFINLGSYYYDDPIKRVSGQFDVVGSDIENKYTFFEVKYTNKPIDTNVINHLNVSVNNICKGNYNLGFISKNGFSNEAKELIKTNNWYSYDLNDILRIIKK